MKDRKITVRGAEVTVSTRHEHDYIPLTDMVKSFDGGVALIEQWLKNKDTVLFLGVWEQINNPSFNSPEFEGIKNEAGRNSFYLSAKKWIGATGAIGLHAKAGRYGGTYAHSDIAFEFASWLSPDFKLYLITEFQRLKDKEAQCHHANEIVGRDRDGQEIGQFGPKAIVKLMPFVHNRSFDGFV